MMPEKMRKVGDVKAFLISILAGVIIVLIVDFLRVDNEPYAIGGIMFFAVFYAMLGWVVALPAIHINRLIHNQRKKRIEKSYSIARSLLVSLLSAIIIFVAMQLLSLLAGLFLFTGLDFVSDSSRYIEFFIRPIYILSGYFVLTFLMLASQYGRLNIKIVLCIVVFMTTITSLVKVTDFFDSYASAGLQLRARFIDLDVARDWMRDYLTTETPDGLVSVDKLSELNYEYQLNRSKVSIKVYNYNGTKAIRWLGYNPNNGKRFIYLLLYDADSSLDFIRTDSQEYKEIADGFYYIQL